MSRKIFIEMLTGISVNLYINLREILIFMVLSVPIHESGNALHLFRFPFVWDVAVKARASFPVEEESASEKAITGRGSSRASRK